MPSPANNAKITMKINDTEITSKIQLAGEKKMHPNFLATVILLIKWESGEYISISGFNLWLSKHGGYNVTMPQRPKFKYCLFEETLWRKIKKEIIRQYEYKRIPIIEEK